MTQQECDDVKAMLKELGTLVPKIEALKESTDSGEGIDVIKKTKEELQSVLHKHSVLRYNLKTWERRSKKIQRIDEIAKKLKRNKEANLSIDELHAIYMTEVWKTKDGVFNFEPTADDMGNDQTYYNLNVCRKKRKNEKQKEDYVRIYSCRPEQITSEPDDVFKENSDIVVFIGEELDFTDKDLPETLKHVSGSLTTENKNAKIPKNLEYVGGHLDLSLLTSAKGLKLPEKIGAGLHLSSLKSAERLVLPKTVDGDLDLESLTSVDGLTLPEAIGGYLHLESLKEIPAEGLKLPETIRGYLYLSSLESAEGLEKLNYAGIIGNIRLPKTFSDKDKEEVEKIKTKQREKGINVNFEYR